MRIEKIRFCHLYNTDHPIGEKTLLEYLEYRQAAKNKKKISFARYAMEKFEAHIKRKYPNFSLKGIHTHEFGSAYNTIGKLINMDKFKGATFAFDIEGNCGFSICLAPDDFDKEKGRIIARGRLVKHYLTPEGIDCQTITWGEFVIIASLEEDLSQFVKYEDIQKAYYKQRTNFNE
jgi:hypothetical protein